MAAPPRPTPSLFRSVATTLLVVVGSAACGAEDDRIPEEAGPDALAPPSRVFAELERRLGEADAVTLEYDVVASGAIEVTLAGSFAFRRPDRADVDTRGRFMGKERDARLRADGERLSMDYADAPTRTEPLPPALGEGLLLGLTRMGVLHGLARLQAGLPPDGTDGKIRERLEPSDFERVGLEGAPAGAADAIRFELTVSGAPSATTTLWLDEDGLPIRREQTTRFPDGEMRVVEVYRDVRLVHDDAGR